MTSIWSTLGLAPTNDATEIRRAYARRLKQVHPEDDPEGFQALRAAYDQASNMARNGWAVQTRRSRAPVVTDEDVRPETDSDDDDDDAEPDHYDTDIDADGWQVRSAPRWSNPVAVSPPSTEDATDQTPTPTRSDPHDPTPSDIPDDLRTELDGERARHDAHKVLCDDLGHLLASPTPHPQAALDALIRIFRSPAMDALDVHERTEYWLAHAVANGGPSADALVEPVIHFFGWDSSRLGHDMGHAIPVLRRRDLAEAIRRLDRGDTPEHHAYRRLKAKPNPFDRLRDRLTFGLDKAIARLFQLMEHDLPGLEAHLNPQATAEWRALLAGPRFSTAFLWSVIILPVLIALSARPALADTGGGMPLYLFGVWVGTAAAMLAGGWAFLEGIAAPALRWQRSNVWGRPLWMRFGWAPASLVLLPLSAILPVGWWSLTVASVAAVGLGGWAWVVTAHLGERHRKGDRTVLSGLVPLAMVLFAAAPLIQPYTGPLTGALLINALVFQLGARAIAEEWPVLPQTVRRKVSLGLIAAAVLTGALVLMATPTLWMPLAMSLVFAVAFADRALGWERFGDVMMTRRFLLMFGWLAAMILAPLLPYADYGAELAAALALWLLLAALLNGLAHFLPETLYRKPRRNRRKPGHFA